MEHIWVVELEDDHVYYCNTRREAEACGSPENPVIDLYREDYCQ